MSLLILPAFKSPNNDSKKTIFDTVKIIKDIDAKLDKYFISSALEEGFNADEAQVFVLAPFREIKSQITLSWG